MNKLRRTFLKGVVLSAGAVPVSGQKTSKLSPAVLSAVHGTAKVFCQEVKSSTATTRELRDLIRASKTLFAYLEEQGAGLVSTFGVTSAGEDYAPIQAGVVSAGEDYGPVSGGDYSKRLKLANAFRKLLASDGVALDDQAFSLMLNLPPWSPGLFADNAQKVLARLEAVAATADEQNNGRVVPGLGPGYLPEWGSTLTYMAAVGVSVQPPLRQPIALLAMVLLLLL